MKQLLLLGIPGLMLAVGGWSLAVWFWTRMRSIRVVGTVERIVESVDHEGDRGYQPAVSFEWEGVRYKFVDRYKMGWRLHGLGQAVSVHFPLGEPNKAELDHWWVPTLYLGIAIAGGAFLALSFREIFVQ